MGEYRLQVAGRTAGTCRQTRVTLKFNAEGELLNAVALARSGLVGWGEWQESHKVKSAFGKCWWCSTPGHGGYILITQEPISFKEPAFETSYTFPTGPAVKVYAYEFEEDCDWAILLHNDPEAFESEVAHRLTWYEASKNIEDVRQELKDAVAKSRKWAKDYEEHKKAEQRLLDEGKFLRCSASTTDDGRVHVYFRNKDGKEMAYYMSKETYDSIPIGDNATPEDYADRDQIEPAPVK